jgi:Holliday junction resolvasome RuvABC endonuclease subunit
MQRTKVTHRKSRVLACDPSFTAWGWAVLEGHLVVEHGCYRTQPEAKKRRIREGDDRVRRTSELIHFLLETIAKFNIEIIVSELPHGSQNAKAAVMIGIVTGIVVTIGIAAGIPVEWYSENDAKKALFGHISASKAEVIRSINELYEVSWTGTKYIDEAVADALAIYYVAECNSPMIKFMLKKQPLRRNKTEK